MAKIFIPPSLTARNAQREYDHFVIEGALQGCEGWECGHWVEQWLIIPFYSLEYSPA